MQKKVSTFLIPVITGIITIIVTSLKEIIPTFAPKTIKILSIVLVSATVLSLAVVGVVFLFHKHRQNSDRTLIDTSAVISRSAKVARDIKKVVKRIDRTIDVFIKRHKTLSAARKAELASVRDSIEIIASNGAIKERKHRKKPHFADLKCSKTNKIISQSNFQEKDIAELNKVVNESIFELSRALLVLQQYDTRIFLGKYVIEHDADPINRAKAYIDLVGWTYSLLGKTSRFTENVTNGIKLIKAEFFDEGHNQHFNFSFKKEFLGGADKEEIAMNKKLRDKAILLYVRAHRHLGSDAILLKKEPELCRKENEKAEIILCRYFDKFNFNELKSPEDYKDEKVNMYVGIRYGILSSRFAEIEKNIGKEDNVNRIKKLLSILPELFKNKECSKQFSNKHRYIKYLVLENEIYKLVEKLIPDDENEKAKIKQDFIETLNISDNFADEVFALYNANTTRLKEAFDDSIYADEVMENFIDQEATQLFKSIERIAK